ncbi:MAG: AEC family transporter [Thiothrix sp.]|nr:AEC family transporter [Thiothrix sp.]
MSVIVAAVLPVFALLILGHVARRTGFLELAFWSQVEKGTYFVLFPALLVLRLVQAEMDLASTGMVMLGAVLTPLTGGLLAYLARPFLQLDGPDFTSLFQGSARFNTYVGLALAATLPAPALMLAALVLAIMIPLVNVLCVLVFAREVHQGGGLRNVVLSILKNPLILGCLCGIALNLSGLQLPALVLEVLGKLAVMALPLGLLAVGAGLRLKALRVGGRAFVVSVLIKLVLLPALLGLVMKSLGLEGVGLQVLVMFAALPTASSAYILARQLGGNHELMAAMITGQTLVALLTLPLVMALVL